MNDKMTSMALSAKDVKETSSPMAVGNPKNAPRFDWGLQFQLNTKSLKKLAMKNLPPVGSYVEVVAFCCVKSVRESEQVDGDKGRSVELQIESLKVEPAKAKMGKAVGKGYKKTEK